MTDGLSIVGLSDGLTVPFALTAGLSGLGSSRLVVTGGLAELCAGAISMGLGGYRESLLPYSTIFVSILTPDGLNAHTFSRIPGRDGPLPLPSSTNPRPSRSILFGRDGT